MSEPRACDAARFSSTHTYCGNCDQLVDLNTLHVLTVEDEAGLVVTLECAPSVLASPRR